MKYLPIIIFLSFIPFNSHSQSKKTDEIASYIDSLHSTLKKNGFNEIVSIHFWRHSTETVIVNDTCKDRHSGYVFWKSDSLIFANKINTYHTFKTDTQPNWSDNSGLNFANIFEFLDYNKNLIAISEIRPNHNDLTDSTLFQIINNDTVYLRKAFGCVDCNSVSIKINSNKLDTSFYWQSIHFDSKYNDMYYLQNKNSTIYNLYLRILRVIDNYDRNQYWLKE